MKKYLTLALFVLICLALVGCSSSNCNLSKDLGKIVGVEVIARSFNATDSVILTMEDGTQNIVPYRGEAILSGQHLVQDCYNNYSYVNVVP